MPPDRFESTPDRRVRPRSPRIIRCEFRQSLSRVESHRTRAALPARRPERVDALAIASSNGAIDPPSGVRSMRATAIAVEQGHLDRPRIDCCRYRGQIRIGRPTVAADHTPMIAYVSAQSAPNSFRQWRGARRARSEPSLSTVDERRSLPHFVNSRVHRYVHRQREASPVFASASKLASRRVRRSDCMRTSILRPRSCNASSAATPQAARAAPPRRRSAGRSSRDARPRGFRHRASRADEAQEVGGVLGMEELRLLATDERQRRAGGSDERGRVDAGELLPEVRIEA